MSEIFNYSPEFVSADELLALANYYTQQITLIDEQTENPHLAAAERTRLRKEKFRLMNRRYYLRICYRARKEKENV
jgi:Leu/Phe-tRNA-protein transferase